MSELILDVGLHEGQDTEFYLAKGFRVAAIDANAVYVEQAKRRFSSFIAEGHLRLYEVAIAEHSGTTDFWTFGDHGDWGTSSQGFAARNARIDPLVEKIRVPCRPFGEILDECGTPYYLKIDIEGSDELCLEALEGRDLPKYVSIEAALDTEEQIFRQFFLLWGLGYRDFKIINQGLNPSVECPYPPKEGCYVDFRFSDYSTGLFGEELPGKWISANDTLSISQSLVQDERLFGLTGRHAHAWWARGYRGMRKLVRRPVAWYDIHARLGDERTIQTIRPKIAAKEIPVSR